MNIVIDIETCPAVDKQPFIDESRNNFEAPSDLTKDQAGKDLNLVGYDLKYKSKADVIALWEKKMASIKCEAVGEEAWRKTALDGSKGRLLSISWASDTESHTSINNPDLEDMTLYGFLSSLTRHLEKHGKGRPPFFIGHNLVFDLKFLFRRCVILGINPGFELPFQGRHDKDYFCTMQAWCEFKELISMDNLCLALGLPGKGDMDGSQVCDYWLAGKYNEIAAYNKADVAKTMQIYKRLKFIAN